MKLVVMPKSKEEITNLIDLADSFVIGIKDLSINLPTYFTIDEAIELIKLLNNHNKEIFISLNKNMHNEDLPLLKDTLLKLNEEDITAIMYYDIGIVNLKNKLNIKHNLVWAQEHLTTNSYTCNYWYDKGVNYTLLSGEITIDEIQEIKNNTPMKLIVPIFGYLPMFASRRHLVKNYLTNFDIKDNSKVNYIYKENKTYPIIDNNEGTIVYSSHILNGIKESLKLKNIDYLLLNSLFIEDDLFKEILTMFKNVNSENADSYQEYIDAKLNTDRGFLYKETVYKVKKND